MNTCSYSDVLWLHLGYRISTLEHWPCNPRVSGSIPGAGNLKKLFIWMKIHGLTIVVCEGATPVGVCDVYEVCEENVHEEDVSEEDVREVRKVVQEVWEVPQNIDIKVTAATVSPIESGGRGLRTMR